MARQSTGGRSRQDNASNLRKPEEGSSAATDRLLPLWDVMQATGVGKTLIYRLMRRGEFPLAYKPGGHASRWSERELVAWQADVAAKRDARGLPPRR